MIMKIKPVFQTFRSFRMATYSGWLAGAMAGLGVWIAFVSHHKNFLHKVPSRKWREKKICQLVDSASGGAVAGSLTSGVLWAQQRKLHFLLRMGAFLYLLPGVAALLMARQTLKNALRV